MRGETAASGGERGEPLAWLALDCECECEWLENGRACT